MKGIGEKTFEQAAGFIRVRDGTDPLDNTSVHPERYTLVAAMAASIGAVPSDLIGNEVTVRQIEISSFVSDDCGLPTIRDICEELIRPGRDPRGVFEPPVYADMVSSIDDLMIGLIP